MKKQVITIGKRDFEIGKRPYVMGNPECDTGFLLGWRKVRRSGCGVEAYRRK
mgnify:CR=1 FL=1